ncbi:MAG: exo-alpha-sialidase [Candidatus Hydrogenedentes bacterium]|nr:exo-alpha-sialidase [Candidatus Hydrogenedentota bacterium]
MIKIDLTFAGLVCIIALYGTSDAAGEPAPQAKIVGDFALWDEHAPLPIPDTLQYPANAFDVVVHRADEEYQFLHDNAVVWHGDTLFAAWYNCPKGEIQGSSCIRARRSQDGGKTWSQVEVIAADRSGTGTYYVPVTFLSYEGKLRAYVSNMVGHDLVTRCEVFALDELRNRWISGGYIAGPFLPNCPPLLMADGNFVMAGRMTPKPATTPEIPAVAISTGRDVDGEWSVVPMMQTIARPYTDYPESTVWLDGPELTAIVRGRLVFTSADFGKTWQGPFQHNLPAEDSKPFALQLSDGRRCLLWNYPESRGSIRQVLAIAVSRPGLKALSAMWKIRHGYADALQAGPEWSYPCAVEHEGALYVIYTSEKRHSVMTVIPLKSLALEGAEPAAQ